MTIRILLIAATVFGALGFTTTTPAQGSTPEISVAPTDWAWWRGPNRNGVAANQKPPMTWDDSTNVLWKVPVPGRGHGSSTVVGDRVFLATADDAAEVQSVICYDRNTGKVMWQTAVHKGGFTIEGRQPNVRASMASATPSCDGERVFINFMNDNAIYLTALSLDGKQLWQKKVTDYVTHQGYGSSTALYGPLVIVSSDNKGGGLLAAYNRVSGEQVWSHKRPELPNYTSPIILPLDGKDQLVLTGCNLISSFDPLTGAVNWEVEGATTECVTSTVSDGSILITSGGYPDKHTAVVKGDGSGETLWHNENMIYVPSVLIHDGHLYVAGDSGEVYCYELKTGTIVWEDRIRTKFAASPVLVGEHIFATGINGSTYIFKASPKAFELVAENTVEADDVQASAAICGDRVYLRVAQGRNDARQEMLYCIGE